VTLDHRIAFSACTLPVCPEPVNELYTAIWAELTK
jgi:hypothetical protein